MRKQLGDPGGVVDVRLAPWNVADVLSVRQHQLEVTLENVPDRLPVDAGRLHGHVCTPVRRQPIRQRMQAGRRRRERPDFLMRRLGYTADRRHHRVLMDVQPSTPGVKYFHALPPSVDGAGVDPASSKSTSRAPGPCGPWPHSGVLAGIRVQLLIGLTAPSRVPTSVPTLNASLPLTTSAPIPLHPSGSAQPMWNY